MGRALPTDRRGRRAVADDAWSGDPLPAEPTPFDPARLLRATAGQHGRVFVSLKSGVALDDMPAPLAPGVALADTLIVPLAGSLGVLTILFGRVGGDWRRFPARTHSPWCPSLRIVHDDTAHDPERAWFEAVERLSD